MMPRRIDVFRECRRRLDLAALIAMLTDHEFDHVGDRLRCRCPLPDHRDSEPSCYLRTEPGDGAAFARWYCYGCERGGDAIDLIEHVEGRARGSALRRAAQLAGVEHVLDGRTVPYERSEVAPMRAAEFAGQLPKAKPSVRQRVAPPTVTPEQLRRMFLTNAAAARLYMRFLESARGSLDYLARRGVTSEQIKCFGLGYAPSLRRTIAGQCDGQHRGDALAAGLIKLDSTGETFDVWRGRLMFPVTCKHDGATVIRGFVGRTLSGAEPRYLNTRATPAYRKGATLFGWHVARKRVAEARRVVLCEGPFDVLAVDRLGLAAVATVSAALTEDQAERLASLGCPVTIALDGDSAGRRGAEQAARVLRAHGVERVDVAHLPQGEDPASMEAAELASRIDGSTDRPRF